jgi:hypothetical protein
MGFYINPPDMPKEDWLKQNGKLVYEPTTNEHPSEDTRYVCLVNNGQFTAAGICYSEDEIEAFTHTTDRRPKRWYEVSKAKLTKVCPAAERVL